MKQNDQYDISIVGGGCAGLQLLHCFASMSAWKSQKTLLLSSELSLQRSWCFWSDKPNQLQHLISKSWSNVCFVGDKFKVQQSIAPYAYHYIKGEDFFEYFKKDFFPKQTNLTIIDAKVTSIEASDDGFVVTSDTQNWAAKNVFSNIKNIDFQSANHQLWQHFKGWFLTSSEPVFDDTTVTIMDFSISQGDDVRFVYVLPFSPTEALVEMTVFSKQKSYNEAIYDDVLTAYMQSNYPQVTYKIDSSESGQIPMCDAKYSFEGNNKEVLIGTSAGMVKSTTGYAFHRIMKDSTAIANGFLGKEKIKRLRSKWRFEIYDKILLGILDKKPQLGKTIFSRLFRYSSIKTVLRFLDEETSVWEEIKIFATLPIPIFVRQAIILLFR